MHFIAGSHLMMTRATRPTKIGGCQDECRGSEMRERESFILDPHESYGPEPYPLPMRAPFREPHFSHAEGHPCATVSPAHRAES